jgi:hypothetical protein
VEAFGIGKGCFGVRGVQILIIYAKQHDRQGVWSPVESFIQHLGQVDTSLFGISSGRVSYVTGRIFSEFNSCGRLINHTKETETAEKRRG